MYPRSALSPGLLSRVAVAVISGRPRSFGADARSALAGLKPPLVVFGGEYLPAASPCLLTVNHYYRLSFQAWRSALALSWVVPYDVH